MRTILYASILLFSIGAFSPVFAFSGEVGHYRKNKRVTTSEDTTKITSKYLPLRYNSGQIARPKFETIHLVLGLSGMHGNYSDLKRLGVKANELFVPLSIYVHVPFFRKDPSFFFTGGWDIGLAGRIYSFKGLFLYQTKYRLLFGFGAGTTWYSYRSDEIIIDANQSYGLLSVGINLSPHHVDLRVTVPMSSPLHVNFEDKYYKIKPEGIELSLLVSLLL